MVATASENGLKVAVFLASCLATTAQTQEATRTPKTNVMPRRHPQFQPSHKHASTKKHMHKPRHPGQQIAEPRCRRLVTCCSPGSLLTESKLFAEVLDLPMTHAATDPRGFTASRRRALSSSACTLPGSYHCKQLARLCHVRLCTAGFHQSRAADGLRAAYTRVP